MITNDDRALSEKEALRLWDLGMEPTFSTGICGSLTCGFGKLDENGYWEFPLYPAEDFLKQNRDRKAS